MREENKCPALSSLVLFDSAVPRGNFLSIRCQLAKQVLLFGRTRSSRQPLETALRNDICCEKAIDTCPLRGGAALSELS